MLPIVPPPLATDPSWLAHLLSCPLPATLVVHVAVGVRSREKHRQRRRWQRLRAAVRYKERRDRLVGSDEEDALEEADLRTVTRSARSMDTLNVRSVAEAAALAAAGPNSRLLAPRVVVGPVTCALAAGDELQ